MIPPPWLLFLLAELAPTAAAPPGLTERIGTGSAFVALAAVCVYVYKSLEKRADRIEADAKADRLRLEADHRAERQALQTKLDELTKTVIDKYVPALESATHATQQVTQAVLQDRARSGGP